MTGLNSCRTVLLFLLISCPQTVSGEDEVVEVMAPVGGAVLLPCLLAEAPPPASSVYWRDKDDNVVLDIVNNADDLQTQSLKFKGRVVGERRSYEAGNFSIQLRDVLQSDGGTFECHVPSEQLQRRVRLTVSGERVVATPPPGPSGEAPPLTPTSWLCFFFFSLSVVAV